MPHKTIQDAKDFLKKNAEEGTICPCCNQTVKVYKVKLTSSMAMMLIGFYKKGEVWVHAIKELKPVNGDYAKLRHWGLLEKKIENDTENKASGYWRITHKGVQFIKGYVTVSEKIRLYNNKFYGYTGKHITLKEALGNKFKFEELMNE